jgi:hypothetical protein
MFVTVNIHLLYRIYRHVYALQPQWQIIYLLLGL